MIKSCLALFSVALGSAFAVPEPNTVMDLYPGDAPGFVAGGKSETTEQGRVRNVSKPGMKVWLPVAGSSNSPALVICAGGGYGHLAMELHVENVVELFTKQGIAVVGLKYRTRYGDNDVVSDALADVKRAMRLTRGHAENWKIDPNRIGVQGYSAGADLCLNLAANFDAGDPDAAADSIDRLSSRPDFVVLMCPWPNGRTPDAFPLGKNTPPTFIAHARDDQTAPFDFASAIDSKLEELAVKHRMFAVDRGGHGAFHYGVSPAPGGDWPKELLRWLGGVGILK